MQAKWRARPIYARMWLPPIVATADPAWVNALVMRALLSASPELADDVLSIRESLFSVKGAAARYVGLFGETVVAIKTWDRDPEHGVTAFLSQLSAPDTMLPGGVRFLGVLDGFEPGIFERMSLRLELPAQVFPDAGQQLRRYLQEQYVPVNLRGQDGGYVFDIPEKARKKRVIFEGRFAEADGAFEAELVVSPKFDLVAYLRSFPDAGRYREARAEVTEIVV